MQYLVWVRQLHKATVDESGYYVFKCGTMNHPSSRIKREYLKPVARDRELFFVSPRHACSNCFTFLRSEYKIGVTAVHNSDLSIVE